MCMDEWNGRMDGSVGADGLRRQTLGVPTRLLQHIETYTPWTYMHARLCAYMGARMEKNGEV